MDGENHSGTTSEVRYINESVDPIQSAISSVAKLERKIAELDGARGRFEKSLERHDNLLALGFTALALVVFMSVGAIIADLLIARIWDKKDSPSQIYIIPTEATYPTQVPQ